MGSEPSTNRARNDGLSLNYNVLQSPIELAYDQWYNLDNATNATMRVVSVTNEATTLESAWRWDTADGSSFTVTTTHRLNWVSTWRVRTVVINRTATARTLSTIEYAFTNVNPLLNWEECFYDGRRTIGLVRQDGPEPHPSLVFYSPPDEGTLDTDGPGNRYWTNGPVTLQPDEQWERFWTNQLKTPLAPLPPTPTPMPTSAPTSAPYPAPGQARSAVASPTPPPDSAAARQAGGSASDVAAPEQTNLPPPCGTSGTIVGTKRLFLPMTQSAGFVSSGPINEEYAQKSGMHLGLRSANDWQDQEPGDAECDFLARLRGNLPNGRWPAVVVALSSEVYVIERNTPGCGVSGANVSTLGTLPVVGRPFVFAYLQRAAAAGTKIIIRIKPSPGNFRNAIDKSQPNEMLTAFTGAPDGLDYCNGRFEKFRTPADLLDEIHAISAFNTSRGILASRVFFEPANEPNLEWYQGSIAEANRLRSSKFNWTQMGAYFSTLYENKRRLAETDATYRAIQILTPAMGVWSYAEQFNRKCDIPWVSDDFGRVAGGYNVIQGIYTDQNDGFVFHDYWKAGKERWVNGGNVCPTLSVEPTSLHVTQFLPRSLQEELALHTKPIFFAEADLFSPQAVISETTIMDKELEEPRTSQSIDLFVNEEQVADYIAVWALSIYCKESDPNPLNNKCRNDNTQLATGELEWHNAYYPTGRERKWFSNWWPQAR